MDSLVQLWNNHSEAVAVVLTAIFTSVVAYLLHQSSKAKPARIVCTEILRTSLIRVGKEVLPKTRIQYGGKVVNNLSLVKLRLRNTGSEEISDVGQEVKIEIIDKTKEKVVIKRSWECSIGNIVDETTFLAGSRKFLRKSVLNAISPFTEIYTGADIKGNIADTIIFLPEKERIAYYCPQLTIDIPYIEAYDPKTRIGLGIKPDFNNPRFGRYAFGKEEGGSSKPWGKREAAILVLSPVFTYEKIPLTFTFEYTGYVSVDGKRPIEAKLPPVKLRRFSRRNLLLGQEKILISWYPWKITQIKLKKFL